MRRFDIAPDGMIWYVNSGAGRLGRFNPKTGEVNEWESPSGPRSHPYGIVVSTAASGTTNPACGPIRWCVSTSRRRTFQSWAIKSGNVYAGILRNARKTREGTLLIHQTATNRIIEVIPQNARVAQR